MKNEFILAFNEVIEDKQLPKEVILGALESAMVSAYRRSVNASANQRVEASIDPETGKVTIYAEKEVVEEVLDDRTEVDLETAKSIDPDITLDSMLIVESTPKDFGRVAAQTARQVIQQRIRDAERKVQLDLYQKQVGEIVSGIVQAANSQGLTVGLEHKAEGNLARKDLIPGERFRIHDRIRSLVAEVKDTPRGPQIVLSRTHRDFLRRLLENEVPEIYHGIVEVRSISREPGERAKVAVSATQSGIDPVGACVGIRGVRIQAIVRELHDEKIDVIEWNADPVLFIAKAISPARVVGVYLNEQTEGNKTATVVVPEDQLSLAIGRDGQNARLAAKLTNWRIDIKSLSEATGDALKKLTSDDQFTEIAETESDNLEKISDLLEKKAEGRPLGPEDYDFMARFMDRVEKRIAYKPEPEKLDDKTEEIVSQIRLKIPEEDITKNLLDTELPEHVSNILQEAGYILISDLIKQMETNKDEIFKLQGIGPKAMKSINEFLDAVIDATPLETAEEVQEEETDSEVSIEETEVEEVLDEVVLDEEVTETEEETIDEPDIEEESDQLEIEQEPVEPEMVETAEQGEEDDDEEEEEEEQSFEELFQLKSDFDPENFENDEIGDEVTDSSKKKKKKKKKNMYRQVEYDPDEDRTVVRRKHKHGDEEWDWDID